MTVTFSQWLALMMDDLSHHYDVAVAIDGDDSNRHGPVGLGKSNILLEIGYALQPYANLKRDLVVRDSISQFQSCLQDRRPFKLSMIDEAEWFFFKQWWYRPEVKGLTPEFKSNRKEQRIWLFCLPVIWDTVEFIRDKRIQWRLKVEKRGTASLYMHCASRWNDEKKDKWGTYITTFVEIPRVPDAVWDRYQDLVDSHVCKRGSCVSQMQKW